MKLPRSTKIIGALLLSMGIGQVASADTLKLKLGNEGTYPPFAITATDGTLKRSPTIPRFSRPERST